MPNTKQTKKPKQPQVKEDIFTPQEIAVVDSLIKLTSGNDKIWKIYWNGAYPWLELESHGDFKITKKLDKELLFGIYNSGMTPYVTHSQLNKETTRLENKITSEVTRLEVRIIKIETRLDSHEATLNEHTKTLNEHTKTLNEHTKTLNEHTKTLNEHTKTLNEHSEKLDLIIKLLQDKQK